MRVARGIRVTHGVYSVTRSAIHRPASPAGHRALPRGHRAARGATRGSTPDC